MNCKVEYPGTSDRCTRTGEHSTHVFDPFPQDPEAGLVYYGVCHLCRDTGELVDDDSFCYGCLERRLDGAKNATEE